MTPQDQLEKQLAWNILKDSKRYQTMTTEEIYNSLGQDIQ
jgi:hypothetical protein